MPFPRLLLVTEEPVAPDGPGMSKTLHELFAVYPGPLRIMSSYAVDDGLDRVHVRRRILPERLARLGHRTAAWRRRLDLNLIRRTRRLRRAVQDFAPDVIVACPFGAWGTTMALQAQALSGASLVLYLMDDWPEHVPDGGVERLLRDADAWLLISDQLKQSLIRRSVPHPPPTLIVHNPARASSSPRRDRAAGAPGPELVVYAGSIWPMHFDALELTAQAVAMLRAPSRDIWLVIHTTAAFWEAHASRLVPLGVVNGGYLTQDELRERLLEADLALLACAFGAEHQHMSRSSVQTKLTDYMAAGAPILGVGPPDAASIDFVQRWKVGHTCTVADASILAQTIATSLDDPGLIELARHSRDVVANNFDVDAVRARLNEFIMAVATPEP